MKTMNAEQFSKCYHALGIDSDNKAYRNYYNSGRQKDVVLELLVKSGLMHVQDRGREMGGLFYTLSNEGLEFMSKALRRDLKAELKRYD